MQRDMEMGEGELFLCAASLDPTATPALRLTERGWRAEDWLERQVFDQLERVGPLISGPGLGVYLGFPWSALIDSQRNPGNPDGPYLLAATHSLVACLPPDAVVVTSCQHPDALAHLALFAAAGVTDLFWTGTPPETEGRLREGIRLHPLPALAPVAAPLSWGQGPGWAFAYCTAENYGNTPALWSALAAGLLPVLPQGARLSLPGPAALWDQVVLRLDPAAEEEALRAIASDRHELRRRREALATLALYGDRQNFTFQVLEALHHQGPRGPAHGPVSLYRQAHLPQLVQDHAQTPHLSPAQAEAIFATATEDLLRGRSGALDLKPSAAGAAAWQLISRARPALPKEGLQGARLASVQERQRAAPPLCSPLAAEGGSRAALKIYLLGPRGQRTPLSYAPMLQHMNGLISLVERPEEADLIVTGWSRDFEEQADTLETVWAKGHNPRLVVLSEEPLWDSLWSGGLSPRDRVMRVKGRVISYRVLSHVTSDIFAFEHLPWFILSNEAYIARQAQLISGFAKLTPAALLAHWEKAPIHAAFVAERRLEAEYVADFPLEEVWGLSRCRSRIAELTEGPGILRLGQGWPGPEGAPPPRRQDIPDWHLDKLARLHGKLRICAAYENTLQRDYITEKPFDAFAVGAIPAVAAPAGHRLRELILPEAMIETQALTPEMAARSLSNWRPSLAQAEAWLESAHHLLARFNNFSGLSRERQRIIEACTAELTLALAEPPQQHLLERLS